MGLNRNLDDLQPLFKKIIIYIIEQAKEKYNIDLKVNETKRSQEIQTAYFAQGRQSLIIVNQLREKAGLYTINDKDNQKTITRVENINTEVSHGAGLACDVVPNGNWSSSPLDWAVIGKCVVLANGKFVNELREFKGKVIWGGNWSKFTDKPHIELEKGV
jgi:hypothetical protein